MRIALVAEAASPHTRPWVEAWRRAGHEVFLFSAQRGEIPPDLGCAVRAPLVPPAVRPSPASGTRPDSPREPSIRPASAARSDSRVTWELRWITRALRLIPSFRAWLRDTRPDLVLALRLQPEGYLASFGSVRPLVIMSWGQDVLRYALGHPAHRLFARRAVDRAELLLGETEPVLAGWRALGAPGAKVALGFTGIDLAFWRPPAGDERAAARRGLARLHPAWEEALTAGAPILLSSRAVARRGHQEELVRAFATDAPADALLLQVGAGDATVRLRCRGLAEASGLGRRYLDLGPVPAGLLRDCARAARAVASLWSPDGLSQSLLEGMGVGLLPIAADLAGNREWIRPGENGLLVDPEDPVQIGRALRTGLTDAELWARAGARNLELLASRADRIRNMDTMVETIVRLRTERPPR